MQRTRCLLAAASSSSKETWQVLLRRCLDVTPSTSEQSALACSSPPLPVIADCVYFQSPHKLLQLPQWHALLRSTSQQDAVASDAVCEFALLPMDVLATMAQCWLQVTRYVGLANAIDACIIGSSSSTKQKSDTVEDDTACVQEVLALWGAQVMLARMRDKGRHNAANYSNHGQSTLSIAQCMDCISACLQHDVRLILVAVGNTQLLPTAAQRWGVVRDIFFILAYTFASHNSRSIAIPLVQAWRYATSHADLPAEKTRSALQHSYLSQYALCSEEESCTGSASEAAPLLRELATWHSILSAPSNIMQCYGAQGNNAENDEATAEMLSARLSAIAEQSGPYV